jgi:hypothetical protein
MAYTVESMIGIMLGYGSQVVARGVGGQLLMTVPSASLVHNGCMINTGYQKLVSIDAAQEIYGVLSKEQVHPVCKDYFRWNALLKGYVFVFDWLVEEYFPMSQEDVRRLYSEPAPTSRKKGSWYVETEEGPSHRATLRKHKPGPNDNAVYLLREVFDIVNDLRIPVGASRSLAHRTLFVDGKLKEDPTRELRVQAEIDKIDARLPW